MDAILDALRKRFRFAEGRTPHDGWDMLHEAGRFPDALLYALLFLPKLSLVEDSVLLSDGSDDVAERFREAKRRLKWPLAEIEASFNMREIPFLFIDRDFTDDEERLVAEAIAETWRRALAVSFPTRRFAVNLLSASENAGHITVEFYEIRDRRD